MAYDRAAKWYFNPTAGAWQQAQRDEDGWRYEGVGPEDAVQSIDDSTPEGQAQISALLKAQYGFDPNDRQVNQDGSRAVQIMGPNGYEQGVITEDGMEMPLSLAQGKKIIQYMSDPKDQNNFERLMEFTEGPRFIASVAGGANLVGGGIGAFQSGGLQGVADYGSKVVSNAFDRIANLPETIRNGVSNAFSGEGFTSSVSSGGAPPAVSTYTANAPMDIGGGLDIDWGQGLVDPNIGGRVAFDTFPNQQFDTSFLNDPNYAGGYDFNTMPTYSDAYPTVDNFTRNLMGYPVNLANSGEFLPYGSVATGTSLLGRILGSGAGKAATSIASTLAGDGGRNIPALLAGGGSILSGVLGSNAAREAARIGADASGAGIAEARRQYDQSRTDALKQYDQSRADSLPFLQTGQAATVRLRQLMGLDSGYTGSDSGYLTRRFTDADMNADPVYQSGLKFGLEEGTKGINQRAVGMGNYDSGATLKALTRYGNDYASTKAGDSYNRFSNDQGNIYNRLAGTSGAGQTASGQIMGAGQTATGQVINAGNNMTGAVNNATDNAASARAAGVVGGANAWGGALGGVANAANSYNQSELLRRILGGNNG